MGLSTQNARYLERNMVKLRFVPVLNDPKLQATIFDSYHSPEAAAELLIYIAVFLRDGRPLPTALATRVANAFEKAGTLQAAELRATVLGRELGLIGKTKPALKSFVEVGE
jgi:hypothetical protein